GRAGWVACRPSRTHSIGSSVVLRDAVDIVLRLLEAVVVVVEGLLVLVNLIHVVLRLLYLVQVVVEGLLVLANLIHVVLRLLHLVQIVRGFVRPSHRPIEAENGRHGGRTNQGSNRRFHGGTSF